VRERIDVIDQNIAEAVVSAIEQTIFYVNKILGARNTGYSGK
jgi:hypothetical protein